jgi:hypothetical protein
VRLHSLDESAREKFREKNTPACKGLGDVLC